MWWTIAAVALSVAAGVVTALLAPKQQSNTPSPATLDQFNFPTVEEGTPQPIVFGDVWVSNWMVLWYGDLETVPIKKKTGGKK